MNEDLKVDGDKGHFLNTQVFPQPVKTANNLSIQHEDERSSMFVY